MCNMNRKVTMALMYATEKHAGQFYPRRDEEWPFITHPIRVALRVASFSSDTATIVTALLHDVVEDTDTPISEIRFRFGIVVASAVQALTRHDDTIPYKDYIRSLLDQPIARIVKIADLQDNLYHCRVNDAPAWTKRLIGRYIWALEFLTSGEEARTSVD